jgi:hypothetical protein
MSDLERLEKQLETPVQEMLESVFPEPDISRLRRIEQSLPLPQKKSRKIPAWLIIVLGLSGIASAFWFATVARDKSTQVQPVYETSPAKNKKVEQSASEMDNQHEQADGVENKNSSAVIYRREAWGNDQ